MAEETIDEEELQTIETEETEEEKPVEAPTHGRKCRYCGQKFTTIGEITKHYKESHPEEFAKIVKKQSMGHKIAAIAKKKQRLLEELEKEKSTSPRTMSEEDIRSVIAIEGREGLNRLKRERLEEVLARHPRVSTKMAEYILFLWDTNENIKEDPNNLWSALRDAGVEPAVIRSIVDSVWSIELKYAPILQEHGIEPRYYTYRRAPQYMPSVYMSSYTPDAEPWTPFTATGTTTPQTPQSKTRFEPPIMYQTQERYPHQPILSLEQVREVIRQEMENARRRDRLQMLEQAVTNMGNHLETFEKEVREALASPKMLKEDKLERIERQMREEAKRYEEEIKKLQDLLVQKEREDLKKEIERQQKELQNIQRMIASVREESRSPKLEGYQSDAFRFMSQMGAEAIRRKPLETLGRILFPERFVGPPTQPKPVTIPESLLLQLEKEGMVE
ncbi:MAG: hypothetical protein QW304_07925 [Thermoproteota archaeon]